MTDSIARAIEALAEKMARDGNRPRIEPLAGDASTRKYFRARYPDGDAAVIALYASVDAPDLDWFLDTQGFLDRLGLPVPQVLGVFREQAAVALEDLGDELLETVAQSSDEGRIRSLYEEAVDLLARMREATRGSRSGCPAFGLAFDMEKLMWEMGFFETHFVRGLCGMAPSPAAEAALQEFFRQICSVLASAPRVFTHRDYHSRNLVVAERGLVMIDFQDARMGPAQYDLASLLRDSYVTLPRSFADELLSRYFHAVKPMTDDSEERFREIFDLMCLQRNIKALGTFGYQVSARGAERYVSSIPRTGLYIEENMSQSESLAPFRGVVRDLIHGPATGFEASRK